MVPRCKVAFVAHFARDDKPFKLAVAGQVDSARVQL
jgi:hypothetical protein